MLVLLLVALLPLGKVDWEFYWDPYNGEDFSGAYAICFFKRMVLPEKEHPWPHPLGMTSDAGAPMVISIMTLSVSYITRVVKMNDTASQWVMRCTRIFFGTRYKLMLKFLHNRAHHSTEERYQERMSLLKVGLCWIESSILMIGYRLALEVFLTLRAVLDLCDSMLWEVGECEAHRLLLPLTRVLHRYCGSFSEFPGAQSIC